MSSQSDCAILPVSPGPPSDEDAFNTAGARIHFGPLRSPEKILASIVARSTTCSTDISRQPSPPTTTLHPPSSTEPSATKNLDSSQQPSGADAMGAELEELHLTDTRGPTNSGTTSTIASEISRGSQQETKSLNSLSISINEPIHNDREQSPVSESSATDTLAVANALVPDSPVTPKATSFPKSNLLNEHPTEMLLNASDTAQATSPESTEGIKTPQPSAPPTLKGPNELQPDDDAATPRAALATPTRPRPSVISPSTIDRELRSLSPTSNHLLGQLLATPGKSPQRFSRFSVPNGESTEATTSTQPTPATFPAPVTLESPQRPTRLQPSPLRSSMRMGSPVRGPKPEGATEFRPSHLPVPGTAKSIFARTGSDTLPPGSPQKSPVRRPPALAPAAAPTSPQKLGPSRLPATPARSRLATAKGVDKSSPVKGTDAPKIRTYTSKAALAASSSSTLSSFPAPTTTTTTTTAFPRSSSSTTTKPLPFPIVPARTVSRRVPASATDSSSDAEPPSSQPEHPEVPKSSLKQSASSKIPRPKPYARPVTAVRKTLSSRRAPEQEKSASNQELPRIPSPTVSSPPSIEEPKEAAPPTSIPASAEPINHAQPPPPAVPSTLVSKPSFTIAPLSPLKRKRPVDEPSDREPQSTEDEEPRRQVKIMKTVGEVPAIVQPQPQTARLVSRRHIVPMQQARTLDEELAAAVASSDPPQSDAPSSDIGALPSSSPPSSSTELPNQEPRSDDTPQDHAISSPEVPPIAAYTELPRRTRNRRTLDFSNEGAGPSTLGSRTVRRRTVGTHLIPPSDNFCGLSAIALKALTSQNTARNEKYMLAKIETEIVRKDGLRPESPGIKAKTIIQRQQEELQKQRQERADRRARRGGEGSDARQDLMDEVDEGDGISDEEEEEEEDQSEALESSPPRPRHRRGPGDDEDYETPIRPSAKAQASENADAADRRVRWDRGLFTEVYLDEVKFGTRKREGLVASKGCLTPKAKALPLDNLGNLPNAASPFTDIEQRPVIIKRFVYDSDIQPEPVPEPVPVKPATRQRSKKAKS